MDMNDFFWGGMVVGRKLDSKFCQQTGPYSELIGVRWESPVDAGKADSEACYHASYAAICLPQQPPQNATKLATTVITLYVRGAPFHTCRAPCDGDMEF